MISYEEPFSVELVLNDSVAFTLHENKKKRKKEYNMRRKEKCL